MRTQLRMAALTLMAAALPITLTTAPALAAVTWTVSPGGSFSSLNAQFTLWDSTTNYQHGCDESQIGGTLQSGSGLAGARIGTITSISPCTGPLTVAWPLNARYYNTAHGVTTGTISKIHFAEPGDCSFVVDGTSATAHNGKVRIKYYNNNRVPLHFLSTGSTLHFYDVSGCAFINNGDSLFIVAYFGLTPRQAITSP